MEEKVFQQIALEKFAEIAAKLEHNDKYQAMSLEYLAKFTQQLTGVTQQLTGVTQQLTEVQEGQKQLDKRMTKLELCLENEVIDKLHALYEKVDGMEKRLAFQEEEVLLLKRPRLAGV